MKKLFDFKNLGSVLLMLSVFASSCKQEAPLNDLAPEATPTQRVMKYKIDGKEMSKDAFYGSFSSLLSKKSKDLNARSASESEMLGVIAEDNRVVWEIDRPESTGTSDVTNAFTNQQAYIDYGISSGYDNIATVENAYSDLASYAVSSGAMAVVEATGELPSTYISYMDEYLASHSLPTSGLKDVSSTGLQTRSAFAFIFKDCIGGSSIPIRISPWLSMFGFNNQVSSFRPVGLAFGRTDIFDRWFFGGHLLGVWSWDNVGWTLCGGNSASVNPFSTNFSFANDKATSWSTF
jgi:hypothetical protein